jgi:hypothetical protein
VKIASIVRVPNGNIEISVSGVPNRTHTLQISDDT